MRTLLATALAVAAAAPVAVTGPATEIGNTSATLQGSVNPEGEATTYYFEYGTTDSYGLTTARQEAGDGTEPVDAQAQITGLTGSTTYHYRLVAESKSGRSEGEDATFETAPNPRPPATSLSRSRNVGPTSAELTASINPRGTDTTYTFEYGKTNRYGSSTPARPIPAGTTAVPVSALLTGLEPFTRYHWRIVATNAAGTRRGQDRTFTTDRLPTGVTLTLSPQRVTWSRALTVGGRVSGAGAARMQVALEAQPFPFAGEFEEIDRTSTGNDGGYLFRVSNLRVATRYRVVTRTSVAATSPVAEAASKVRVERRGVRHLDRLRARIRVSVAPAVAGLARLQRKRPRGGWKTIARRALGSSDSTRTWFSFKVRRRNHERRYRVVVRPTDDGAHVTGRSGGMLVRARRR